MNTDHPTAVPALFALALALAACTPIASSTTTTPANGPSTSSNSSTERATRPVAPASNKLNLATYEAIAPGMSPEAVESLLGVPPTIKSESRSEFATGTLKIVTKTWTAATGDLSITVTFQNSPPNGKLKVTDKIKMGF